MFAVGVVAFNVSCIRVSRSLLRSAVARLRILSTAQMTAVALAAVSYIAAGALHFIKPAPVFEDHAALHSVACGDGAGQRCF